MARRSKPWAVLLSAPQGSTRTEHRSEPEAYRKVAVERVSAEEGHSETTVIRVFEWEPDYNRWALYERIEVTPKEQQR